MVQAIVAKKAEGESRKDIEKDFERLKPLIFDRKGKRAEMSAVVNDIMAKTSNSELIAKLGKFKERLAENENKIKWAECEKFYNESYGIYSGMGVAKPRAEIVPVERRMEKEDYLVQALIALDKTQETDTKWNYKRFEELKSVKNGKELAKKLEEFGMPRHVAEWYADKMWNDRPYRDFITTMGKTPFDEFRVANLKMQNLFYKKTPQEIEAARKDIEAYYGSGEHEKAALNFLIAKRYGDIRNIGERLNEFYGKNNLGKKIDAKGDETQILLSILSAIRDDKEYEKNLKDYVAYSDTKKGVGSLTDFLKKDTSANLDRLDILGKYAFLRMSYPPMVKTYGNLTLFADYLQKMSVPTQLQFLMFSEIVPYLVEKGNPATKIMNVISMTSAFGNEFVGHNGWNRERELYRQGQKIRKQGIERTEQDFLKQLINDALKDSSASDPVNKYLLPDKEAFKQKTEVERVYQKVMNALQQYAPTIRNELERMLDVSEVRTVEELVNAFRRLFTGQQLNFIDMGRGTVNVNIELDEVLFSRYLNDLMTVEPMPPVYTRWSLRGDGSYSYRQVNADGTKDESATGMQTIEYRRWGPTGAYSVYGSIWGDQKSTSYKVGSHGEHLYGIGGREVNYLAEYMKESERQQLYGFLDAYKEDMNTFVQLRLVDEKETTYEAIVYQRTGSQYIKVAAHKLSGQDAGRIFAGYVDYKADARVLFEDGSIKGLVAGMQLTPGIGAAVLKNAEQFSSIVTFTSPAVKIGARVYTDKNGAKQLGMTTKSEKIYLEAAAGKENEETQYALNLKMKLDGVKVAAMAVDHLDRIMALGIDSRNAYFLLDYIKRVAGEPEIGITSGIRTAHMEADLAWYSKPRAVQYVREDTYMLNELLDKKAELAKHIRDGDVDAVSGTDQLKVLDVGIDRIRTIIGRELTTALSGRWKKPDGTYGVEYIGGDSHVVSYYMMGKKNSYRLSGSVGNAKSLEYTRIAGIEREAATLISAGFLSVDDVAVISGRYGRASAPTKPTGSGVLFEAYGGKGAAGAAGGYYKWYEPPAETLKTYQAVVGRIDEQSAKEDLLSSSIGYGYTTRKYDQQGNYSTTYYIIVRGARTKDDLKKAANLIGAELGIKYDDTKLTGERQTVGGGLTYTRVAGTDKEGNKIELFFQGYIERPVGR